jgi:small subunit ribosomal protein S17
MADEEKTQTTEEQPTEETPVEETPAVAEETPVVEEAPAVEETPAAEEPAVEPVAEAETPAADEPAAEEPAAAADAEASSEAPEAPAAAAEPEVPAEPQAQSQPKKKFKRPPRSERPKKTRVTRPAPTGERKPISREPKPEHDRGRRQERRGVVVSDAMDKTIVVKVDTIRAHPRYKKVIRRSTKFHAHDEANSAKVGDLVRIVETRPLSKTKNWRLAEIVEAAK